MLDIVNLPEHRRVFDSLLRHFRNIDGAIGLFVSGSQATGEMDEQSDLDLGVVLDSQKSEMLSGLKDGIGRPNRGSTDLMQITSRVFRYLSFRAVRQGRHQSVHRGGLARLEGRALSSYLVEVRQA